MNMKCFTKKPFSWVFVLFLILISCSEGSSKSTKKTESSSRKPKEESILSSIDYSIIQQWKPDNNQNGLGADILLKQDLSKEEIISFLKQLSKDKDPVLIKIYTSQEAYKQEKNETYGKEFQEGYLLFYVRNTTGKGAYRGFNEIRWMQEIGKFSSLLGQKTKL